LQIAILLYPGVTALDAIGPWEVLSLIPRAEVRFVGIEPGPVAAEGDALLLGVTHALAETPAPSVVLVPGGSSTPGQMVDDCVLGWLRATHASSQWTASVCTGSLILGAAGILKGKLATTHWSQINALRIMGAKAVADERVFRDGKIVTAAGVSAGIDLALWLAGELAGAERAQAIQLVIEYDPRPPFDAGNARKASSSVQQLARALLADRMLPDQKRLMPQDCMAPPGGFREDRPLKSPHHGEVVTALAIAIREHPPRWLSRNPNDV
jgi:transcriptional regulator GlxA family with amidase domain